MSKTTEREVGMRLVQFILNDEELEHLTVSDLRNVLLNLQDVLSITLGDGKDEESEEDLTRYIL